MTGIFKKLLFATAMASMIILSGCGRLSSLPTAQLLNTGTQLAKEGKWAKAYDHAVAAAKKEPGNISAQLLLALTAEGTGKMPRAIEAAKEAVAINPDSFQAQYTLGRFFAKDSNKLQDAVNPLLTANKLDPRHVEVKLLIADTYARMKMYDTAVVFYKDIIANHKIDYMTNKNNAALVWNQMSIISFQRNEDRNAALYIKEAIKYAPENPHILLNLAIILDHAKRVDLAVPYYGKYLEVTSKNPELAAKQALIKGRIAKLSGR